MFAHLSLSLGFLCDPCFCVCMLQARAEQLERAAAEVDQAKAERAAVRKRQLESATGAAVGGYVRIRSWGVWHLKLYGEGCCCPWVSWPAHRVVIMQAGTPAVSNVFPRLTRLARLMLLPQVARPCRWAAPTPQPQVGQQQRQQQWAALPPLAAPVAPWHPTWLRRRQVSWWQPSVHRTPPLRRWSCSWPTW